MKPPSDLDWGAVLDRLELSIRTGESMELPPGQVPMAFLGRLVALHQLCEEQRNEVESALVEVRAELGALRQQRPRAFSALVEPSTTSHSSLL